jgi:hypothetical protein
VRRQGRRGVEVPDVVEIGIALRFHSSLAAAKYTIDRGMVFGSLVFSTET